MWGLLILVVTASCATALFIAWAVGRGRADRITHADDDNVGIKIGAAFGVYGIILGFAVVVAQQSYTDAQYSLRQEAGAAVAAVHVAQALPGGAGQPTLDGLAAYLKADLADWSSLSETALVSTSSSALDDVYVAVQDLSVNPAFSSAQQALFTTLVQIDSGRTNRILVSRDGTPMFTWILLVGGGALVIAMAALLHFESNRLRILLLVGMTALISVALFTIWALSNPFAGPIPIDSEPLQHVLQRI